MAKNDKKKGQYKANLEHMEGVYETDPLSHLYNNLNSLKKMCFKCNRYQKREKRPAFSMSYETRAMDHATNAESITINYPSPDLMKGIREWSALCVNGKCDEANELISAICKDNFDDIIRLKGESLEKMKEREQQQVF